MRSENLLNWSCIDNMNDSKNRKWLGVELFIRFILLIIFIVLEYAEPFHRKIHPDELWLYKNPRTESYFPTRILWVFICVVPFCIIVISNLIVKCKLDALQAFLALTLNFGINGLLTNSVKLIVGRPRPDFFYRCFPDGNGDVNFPCTGKKEDTIEGLKSFPSGHSSFAFASMTFCSLYLCGKLGVFSVRGRGKSWRLIVSSLPLFLALTIALSRTCDYHHHWQDVLVGSLLGLCVAYLCYFQYYHPLDSLDSALPFMAVNSSQELNQMKKCDSLENVAVKWI
ncbi:phospholipid phosphatase 5 isoform X1 [Parasteatoda tepidariorum]|uniref:phospholipid phosphatase 5 isoform X1 n=2 Tax=Parasteatoda tepidariorum TaxID=114398 RepID=UPI001C727E0C|nr:phospholipid phosphatase 5 isoform X1 [Parasteatoda tepidariorum]